MPFSLPRNGNAKFHFTCPTLDVESCFSHSPGLTSPHCEVSDQDFCSPSGPISAGVLRKETHQLLPKCSGTTENSVSKPPEKYCFLLLRGPKYFQIFILPQLLLSLLLLLLIIILTITMIIGITFFLHAVKEIYLHSLVL